MTEQTLLNCNSFIRDIETIAQVFQWDSSTVQVACASLLIGVPESISSEHLKEAKELINLKTGLFSSFKGFSKPMLSTILAKSEAPVSLLDSSLQIHQKLKNGMWDSSYLPHAAMLLADSADQKDIDYTIQRTHEIYHGMKKNHPFLTSSEDVASCALLALSDKTTSQLINDTEECFTILKSNFFSTNAVQSLAFVLSMYPGSNSVKCQHFMDLFQALKYTGHKYGTEYELATLGVLSMIEIVNHSTLIDEMLEIDEWLSKQKRFGFFSGISKKQRLMYSGMLSQQIYMNNKAASTAAISGTISALIAQQAALIASMSACMAASAAASSAAT